jgi:hypothetical protein
MCSFGQIRRCVFATSSIRHPRIRASGVPPPRSAAPRPGGIAAKADPFRLLDAGFSGGSRPVERGKDRLARLTRKRRSTLRPGYAIKHLVLTPPAAKAAP